MAHIDYSKFSPEELIAAFERGAGQLRVSVEDMSAADLRARIEPGKWSVLEVVCHIADFDILYAERIRRVLAEHEPTIFNGEPDDFERALAYDARDLAEELSVIAAIRGQTARILRSLPDESWQRRGIHSTAGPITLRDLTERIAHHLPHHLEFITRKREALTAAK